MNNNLIVSASTKNAIGCVLALSVLSMAGCGKESSEKKATQVAVKVNDSEITVHQVNQILQASGKGDLPPDAPNKVLESLIDQELLIQKAIANHLDRDPGVVMAIENSRRQILSQSYVQKQVLDQSPVDAKAKQDYYQQHPDLFSKRKIYQFQIFNLETPKLDDALNGALEKVTKPEQVRELLKQHNVKFQEESVARPAEQLPLEMLGTFAAAKVGDIIILPQAESKVLLMQVINFAERPVTLEQAQSQIEQFIITTKNKKALDDHLKQLRSVATLTYEGDFAKSDNTKEAAQPVQKIPAPANTKPEGDAQKILESGFK